MKGMRNRERPGGEEGGGGTGGRLRAGTGWGGGPRGCGVGRLGRTPGTGGGGEQRGGGDDGDEREHEGDCNDEPQDDAGKARRKNHAGIQQENRLEGEKAEDGQRRCNDEKEPDEYAGGGVPEGLLLVPPHVWHPRRLYYAAPRLASRRGACGQGAAGSDTRARS